MFWALFKIRGYVHVLNWHVPLLQTSVVPVMKKKYPWHSYWCQAMCSVFHLSSSLCKMNPWKGAWHYLSVGKDSPDMLWRELVQILRTVYQDKCSAPRVISALCQAHFTATQTSLILHKKITVTTGSAIAGYWVLLKFVPWDCVSNVLHQNFHPDSCV